MPKAKKSGAKKTAQKRYWVFDVKGSDENIIALAVVGGVLLLITTLVAYYGF